MTSFFTNVLGKKIIDTVMEQIGQISVEWYLLCAFVGIGVVFVITTVCYLRGRKVQGTNVFAGILMVLYGSFMLQLTLVGREEGSETGVQLELFHGLIGPDNEFRRMMFSYAVLNGALFVPYGFVLSLFSGIQKKSRGKQCVAVLLLSLETSLLIEMIQLVTGRGYFEVQDLFINTLGGMAGWMLFQVFCVCSERIKLLRKQEE